MSIIKNILVLIKQVPDQSSKAGINPDGTIDRAKAKRMLNPFDRFALQAALDVKQKYGGKVTAISMGPPAAQEVLLEAIEHGVDKTFLLSDKRLAASDTLATAYALYKVIKYVGAFDMIFCGLQTTDGDTAQVGPQIAERLGLSQITYCEGFEINGEYIIAKRVVEGGSEKVKSPLPVLVTVANSYHHLKYKDLRGAKLVQDLQRNKEELDKYIKVINLDDVEADPIKCGLKGSPTIVARTDKVSEIGGSCIIKQGHSVENMVSSVIQESSILEFIK